MKKIIMIVFITFLLIGCDDDCKEVISYYESGEIKIEKYVKDDLICGKYIEYYKSGFSKIIRKYQNGEIEEEHFFDKKGNIEKTLFYKGNKSYFEKGYFNSGNLRYTYDKNDTLVWGAALSYNSKGDLIEDAQIYGDSIAYLFIFENGDLVKEVRKIDISFNDFDGRLEIDSKLNTCKYNSFKNLDSCVHYYTVFDEKMDEIDYDEIRPKVLTESSFEFINNDSIHYVDVSYFYYDKSKEVPFVYSSLIRIK